jgi:UDP-N-acetylglucosamine transferase subunit ALG13
MFPFDRLIRAMDEHVAAGRIPDRVFAQIGSGSYEPRAIEFERFMEKSPFEDMLKDADCIVSHAGIGSIATALAHDKPMLVLPRLKRHGEHVNDHQVATAGKYAELGHVLVAYDEADIPRVLQQISTFKPARRTVNVTGVAERIDRFLRTL